jgi:SAM-dependent methyltransferase
MRVQAEGWIMSTVEHTGAASSFLDMQAAVGVTKHIGGFDSTDELLSLCHIEDAREVLNVGCGIGVASVYIAKKYGCHVVGADISEKMIEWSRRRAREAGVESKVQYEPWNQRIHQEDIRRTTRGVSVPGIRAIRRHEVGEGPRFKKRNEVFMVRGRHPAHPGIV